MRAEVSSLVGSDPTELRHQNLTRLFAPSSVAVVGASVAPEKVGHQALLALKSFAGDVFPINPKAHEILGRKVFPSLRAVGRPVDLVLFAVPAEACVAAMREAIECGCGGGLILSGGFAEAGAVGSTLQDELRALCAQSAFRLLGPNTAGFVNKTVSLTASFVLAADRLPAGSVAVVAQSAGVNLTVSFLLAKLGYGVSSAVGLGNAVDVDAADVLDFLAEQPSTKAIALHLEGVQQGRKLYEAVKRITLKKPVALLTVGKADVQDFARSHTGNLLGSCALRSAALQQAGAVVVESTEELAAAAAVLSRHRLRPAPEPGIGIITAQAGPGLLILDHLRSHGVAVPTLQDSTVERIGRCLPPMTFSKNPVDTGRPSPAFPEILTALADDERVDAILAYVLHEPAALRPEEVLPGVTRKTSKPIIFGTVGPAEDTAATITELRRQGMHVAGSPEELARTAVVLVRDATLQARRGHTDSQPTPPIVLEIPAERDEHSAKLLLEALGVPTPRRIVCASHKEAHAALHRLGRPVVAKILAREIAHKTEVGGVQLDIDDDATLSAALARLDAISLTSPRRYLIEEMAPPGLELIVGAVRDPSFGPTLTVGLGGTLAEALEDTVTRLAPITVREAQEMLSELRTARLLDGWRGAPKLDRGAVAHTLVSLGGLLCADSSISEFELNPLRVYPHGVLALDALLV